MGNDPILTFGFTSAGPHTVQLKVTDNQGATAVMNASLFVQPPTAVFLAIDPARLDASAGGEAVVTIRVRNSNSFPVTVSLAVPNPEAGWRVALDPVQLTVAGSAGEAMATLRLQVPANASSGIRVVTARADLAGGSPAEATLQLSVHPRSSIAPSNAASPSISVSAGSANSESSAGTDEGWARNPGIWFGGGAAALLTIGGCVVGYNRWIRRPP